MSMIRKEIENQIRTNKVLIYSKTWCPYCRHAKEAISNLGVPFRAIELDVVSNGEEIQNELYAKTGIRTVPNIFVNGQSIGGCDKTLEAIQNGSFQKILQAGRK